MQPGYSEKLRNDAHRKVQSAIATNGIVDLILLAEQMRLENIDANIAREDLHELVLQVAQFYGAAVEFDEQTLAALDLGEPGADNRNDLDKMLRDRAHGGGLLQMGQE